MAAATIPELFEAAVAEVPDAVWLRADTGEWTYAQARERILGSAAALADRGAARGELVLATMRNTPDHLFTWLGLMYLGAILAPVDPRSSEAELAGLIEQVAAAGAGRRGGGRSGRRRADGRADALRRGGSR